jgi:glycosyltransferase involved in cell wall biosynthesis
MITASVVVCTHNRASVVGTAVAHALAEARAAGGEVVVVDNASSDGTAAVLAEAARGAAGVLRVVREPSLGLSAARNRGLAEARGAVVAYLDDDAVPRAGWLAALLAPYADARVACVGGRIVLRFPVPPPSWLTPRLHGSFSAFDLGSSPKRLRYREDDYPYGANISFRADTARAAGGFSTLVGPLGRHQLVFDETDLCFRLDQAGWEIRYAPDAVVDHIVLPERLTPEWVLQRHRSGGESEAVFVLRNRRLLRALWRVWWRHRAALAQRPYAVREPIDPARFAAECQRRAALGYLAGLLRTVPRLHALRRDRAR